jgi:hypothetical protein
MNSPEHILEILRSDGDVGQVKTDGLERNIELRFGDH